MWRKFDVNKTTHLLLQFEIKNVTKNIQLYSGNSKFVENTKRKTFVTKKLIGCCYT